MRQNCQSRMENRKPILVVYLVASALSWAMARAGFNFLYTSFYQVRRLAGMQYMREAFPAIVAVALFLFLYNSTKINTTLEDVIAELKKVTWPSYPDVVKATTVVLVCITLASLMLAGFDLAFGKVIQWLMPG